MSDYSKLVTETGLTLSLEQLGKIPVEQLDELLLRKMGMSKEQYDRVMQLRPRVEAYVHEGRLRLQSAEVMESTVATLSITIDTVPPLSFPPLWGMAPPVQLACRVGEFTAPYASGPLFDTVHAVHTVPSVSSIDTVPSSSSVDTVPPNPFWRLAPLTPLSTNARILPPFGSIPMNAEYCRTNAVYRKPASNRPKGAP
ncbi:hypothetical protein PFISCL1PPCAC_2804, partial [Pristionchus fissidentatus]